MFNVHFGEVDVFRGAQFAQPYIPELLANGTLYIISPISVVELYGFGALKT